MRRQRTFIPLIPKNSTNMLELPDCVALLENGKCKWQNKTCQGKECTIKMSQERYQISLHRWKHRLSNLKESKQIEIAKKYYRVYALERIDSLRNQDLYATGKRN